MEMEGDFDSPSKERSGSSSGKGVHAIVFDDGPSERNFASFMEQKIKKQPKLLQRRAGSPDCNIFRVHQRFKQINKKAYHPQIVSIGPFHHGRKDLTMMEEHKWRILHDFLARMNTTALNPRWPLESIFKAMSSMESRIRNSYSERIDLSTTNLFQMMILDGVFILDILYKINGSVPIDRDDPIFNIPWIFSFLLRDLIRLENQIPFFVLEYLFDISREGKDRSLPVMALNFFNYGMRRPDSVLEWYDRASPNHLLDLFRLSLIPTDYKIFETVRKVSRSIERIPCSKKLRRLGIKLKPRKMADSFLDMRFRRGVLEIPAITLDDFTTCALFNCIALEQCCSSCSTNITDYVAFMGCLVSTPRDADFVSELKIVENYMGSNGEVADFFNNISKDVALDIESSSFAKLYDDVNQYRRRSLRARLAALMLKYFGNPWSLLSVCAAFLLLLLTLIQTWYAVLGYVSPPK